MAYRNPILLFGAALSLSASFVHLAIIAGGPDWYRFFGAGEAMAAMAERGDPQAALITCGIAAVLAIWALYAFSAATLRFRLPLRRLVLTGITAVYVARGIGGFFLMNRGLEQGPTFWLISSAVCLVFGLVHLIGLIQAWKHLRTR